MPSVLICFFLGGSTGLGLPVSIVLKSQFSDILHTKGNSYYYYYYY